jgi:hypothetical protein
MNIKSWQYLLYYFTVQVSNIGRQARHEKLKTVGLCSNKSIMSKSIPHAFPIWEIWSWKNQKNA